ncbi:fibroleukin [Limosa lapponica baueri]|uniref:Fibroleukin n=1 Tax=Limosa lapponica baueri TaxID=1758121 RepID=A0A2I0TRM4_LIMLA|nr:fibroleukin [Limosa lapponica baueri]
MQALPPISKNSVGSLITHRLQAALIKLFHFCILPHTASFSAKMKLLVYLVLLKTALLALTNVFAVVLEDEEEAKEGKATETCPIKLKTNRKCDEGEDCPYQINLPPMTMQLPKEFRLLEKTLKEVQTLKEAVNKLKKCCQDCKLQADDNQERDSSNEFLLPNAETPAENSKIQDNRVKELQSKVNRMATSLKNAKREIQTLNGRLEKMSLINMNNVEHYVDSKVANLTFVVNSLDNKCSSKCPAMQPKPVIQIMQRDCADHYRAGRRSNGIYRISPDPKNDSFEVYCDMQTHGGGWTMLQRRQDGSTNFNRTWNDYKNGFGNLSREFWLGNDKIHLLTKSQEMQLRIELEDFNGIREYAKYEHFYVANEYLKYRLSVHGYSGTAGDALHYSKHYNHDQKFFTTPDKDNDRYPSGNCGAFYSSGWWFDACLSANLNGKYYHKKYKGVRNGIFWGTWHGISDDIPGGYRQPFKSVKIMIRPKSFVQ